MKITKRFTPLFVASLLFAALTGCTSGGNQPVAKKDAEITIALTNDQQFNENEFVEPQITVNPASLQKTVSYYKGQEKLNAAPQSVGDYTISVLTAETAEYKATTATKNFLIRKVPTLKFYVGDTEIQDNAEVNVGSTITVRSSVDGANPTLKFYSTQGLELQGMPETTGMYTAKATVARTTTIGSVEAEISFELKDAAKVDPVIKFFYNGVQSGNAHWVREGFGDSQFYPDEWDITKLTWTVEPSTAQYTMSYAKDEVAIDALPETYTKGTYVVQVNVAAQPGVNAGFNYVMFTINERSTKATPVITYYLNGEATSREAGVKCITGSWGTSTFKIGDTVSITFTVDPKDEANTDWWYELNEVPKGKTLPTEPGTYAFVVDIQEGENHTALHDYVLFVLEAALPTPVITYYLNGEATSREAGVKCITGSWGTSTFKIGDTVSITFTVNPKDEANTDWWYELNEVNKGQTFPTEPGTYAFVVDIKASATHNAIHDYVLFVLEAA